MTVSDKHQRDTHHVTVVTRQRPESRKGLRAGKGEKGMMGGGREGREGGMGEAWRG